MKKTLLLIPAMVLITLTGSLVYANSVTSLASGNWGDGSTWTGGITPQCGDSVFIMEGHTIQVHSNVDFSTCGNVMRVHIAGNLHFQTGNKMVLPSGSSVAIVTGGMLGTDKGLGNSCSLYFGTISVWNTGKGTLTGPSTLQLLAAPAELVHFSAKPGTDGIILSWVTASEFNNAGFIIEKSSDGTTFTELGATKGAGTSSLMSTYRFVDKKPTQGLQYYRLSQKDQSGATKAMNPITIRWNHNPDFNVYPNPSKGALYANVASSFNKYIGLLMITNEIGNVIVSRDISFREKTKAVTLVKPAEPLSPGDYVVNIICNGSLYTQDVMVH